MSMAAIAILVLVATLELVGTSFCALWPVKHQLSLFKTWHGWQDMYSLSGSNLDVWLVSVLHTLLISLVLSVSGCSGQRRCSSPSTARTAISFFAAACQVCAAALTLACFGQKAQTEHPCSHMQAGLLAKCVLVALLGGDNLMPVIDPHKKEGGVGLVFMFASVLISAVGLMVQAYAAQRVLTGRLPSSLNS